MDPGTRPTADEVKAMVGLEPHPTCGFVAETYRSPLRIPADALPDAPFPGRERLPVRLRKPSRTRRLDGTWEERGRDDVLRSRPRFRGDGHHQIYHVVV